MSELPEFRKPPVREVLIGVQFQPLPGLLPLDSASMLTELSKTADGDWRRPELRQPTGQMSMDGQSWDVATEPGLRSIVQRTDHCRQLQLENGWLVMSWIRQPDGEEYPRYKGLRAEFDPLFERLSQLISELLEPPDGADIVMSLGDHDSRLRPNFWEFSYVNAVPAEGHWSAPTDWHSIFPGLVARMPHLPAMKAQDCVVQTIALHDEFDGRVEVDLRRQDEHIPAAIHSGKTGKTGKKRADITAVRPSLSLRITVQGQVGRSVKTWQEGIDAGHRTGVVTFASLLSDKAKKEFGYVGS